jgi:exocyst complex component 4
MQPQQSHPSTPAFREMERVLAKVASEWPELLPPAPDDETGEPHEEDNFDPVTLALSLVNEEGSQRRLDSFLATKDALSQSLKSSIQTHYRAFDASASSYTSLVLNLTHAQKDTTELRKVLEEVRETLGKRRTDLAVLEARRTELAEMDRILMTIETLRSIPDRLENLLSDKQFLPAASLLMRSLKMINRAEMREVAATADLRSYFASQEAVSLPRYAKIMIHY